MDIPHKTALLCVLNWGMGHATRCVPLIQALQQRRVKIVIASDGAALAFLQQEFPDLCFEKLPAYNIQYPENENMAWAMAKQLPALLLTIAKERMATNKLVKRYQPNFIISDNRYGCYHKHIKSIFITHQLHLQAPFNLTLLANAANKFNHMLISNFSECWVPDAATTPNAAGALSHPPLHNTKFIGILSRLSTASVQQKKYKVMALLSGPEPQRSILQTILLKELKKLPHPSLLVKGTLVSNTTTRTHQITEVDFMNQAEITKAISESEVLICRSGYSTIMDLIAMQPNTKVIFIPTPGQTEQEYLAQKLANEKCGITYSQKKFSLSDALEKAENITTFKNSNYILESSTLLSQALTSVITD